MAYQKVFIYFVTFTLSVMLPVTSSSSFYLFLSTQCGYRDVFKHLLFMRLR